VSRVNKKKFTENTIASSLQEAIVIHRRRSNMTYVFLSAQFYAEYDKCTQIEQKANRPYIQVYIKLNGLQFAIPLRSGITHKDHVLWTNKEKGCGLDFSKAVIVLDEKYINKEIRPHIRQDEFDSLRGKEYIIKQNMLKHIKEYKKAKARPDIKRNAYLCAFSTMQYFEDYIKDIDT
jgi:protein AbiQ